MTLYKIFKYLAIAIGVIAAYFVIRVMVAGEDAIKTSGDLQASIVSPFLYVAYIVLALTIVLVLVFVIKELFTGHPKNTFIAIGAFVAIILIAYLVTDGQPTPLRDGGTLSANATHWVSAGLVVFYIMAILAIGAMLMTGVKKITTR
ncbi:MAG TPA: hypothetical protein VFM65_08005 [Flavobacteriaceae bacterium]|nr:hypothetical protein [Flavobacteriaceae bacterium]